MKPIKFKEQNKVYIAEGCGDLPVYQRRNRNNKLLERYVFGTYKVFIYRNYVVQRSRKSQPPIWLDTAKPFEEAQMNIEQAIEILKAIPNFAVH